MDVKCIKSYSSKYEEYDLDEIFIKDKWYTITSDDKKLPVLILDNENYYHYIGMIAKSISWIRKGVKEEDMKSVMPGYLSYKEVNDRYTMKITVPTVKILSESNSINPKGRNYEYIVLTRKELIDMYGSCKFTTSYRFFEDYFETRGQIREALISNILT